LAARNIKIGFGADDVCIVYHTTERIFALKGVSHHKLQALDVYCHCAVVIGGGHGIG
jgi:hypothetical protein